MSANVPIAPPVDIYAVFERFNYKAWTALAEFVDNSIQSFVDNRDRLDGPPYRQRCVSVHITFDASRDRVLILDDAAGIPLSEFPRAFRAAVPPANTTGMNEFGMGMKCAAFWFTKKWSVRTRHLSDNVTRTVTLDLNKIREEQASQVPVKESPADGWHGTNIVLEQVGDRLPRGTTPKKVREFLADIYRVPLRDGYLKLIVDGEDCEVRTHQVLSAPLFDASGRASGSPRVWRKDIRIQLPGKRLVTGMAGIFAKGDRNNAGFTLFRRHRVVDGFPGSRWMPEELFGKKNSFESMRVFGELHFEGFSVSSQKDQLDWSGLEEDFQQKLKEQLNQGDLPILRQARNFRSNPVDEVSREKLEKELGEAVDSTVEALAHLGGAVASHPVSDEEKKKQPAVHPSLSELVIKPRKIEVPFEGATWIVEIQFPKQGDPKKWLDIRGGVEDHRDESGNRILQIRIALDHPFSRNFVRMESEVLEPLLRVAAALALAEKLARLAGVETPTVIRSRMNEVLSNTLGNAKEP